MGKCWSFPLPLPPPRHTQKEVFLNIFSLIEDESRKVDCNEVLAELETINEDLAEIGILLVSTL